MLDRLEFLLGEALVALRRNGLMTFAAISTVAVSLFLLGGLGYAYFRVNEFAKQIPGKFEMRVYLRDGVPYAGITQTASQIRAIPGVRAVYWIPKEKAWELKQKESPELTEGLDNPFPDGYKVTVTELSLSDSVAAQIRALPTVDPNGVTYMKDEQQFVDQSLRLIRWLGAVFGGLLFLTGGVLIYNAIRLTVHSRRLEIRTMQLVGASKGMVRIPFLIEGIFQGALGGVIATFMIQGGNELILRFLQSMKSDISAPTFPLWALLGIFTGIGAFYGLLCSLLAVRAPLRFR